jgi:DHA1 family bicyclomycin/chloramphenicol resistance-like MFS transporter
VTTQTEAFDARMGRREFIVLMSMLMALTALAIDMMLPAFGEMRSDFGLPADSNAVALIVTVLFLGIGLGQLVWGPLADALGRKRILWAGLAVYIVGALGGALAPSLEILLAWRFVMGLGAAGVRVVAHGTVRDRYRGDAMAKALSYIMAIFILVPMIAPSLGSIVLLLGTWRWVFAFFVVAGALMAAWALRLPESLPPERRIPLDLRRLVEAGRSVISNRFTIGFTLAATAMFGFFASYLATTQLIVEDVFGLAEWFPLIFGGASITYGLATLLNPRFIDRFGLRRMLRSSLVGLVLTSIVFASLVLATDGRPPFPLYLASIMSILVMHALSMPNLTSAAMMPMGHVAGTAAAVIGAVSTLGGAAMGALIDARYDGSLVPMGLAAVAVSLVALTCARWADAVWDRTEARDQVAPEDQEQAQGAAPIEVG